MHWQLGGGVLDGLGLGVERRRFVGGDRSDSILAAQQQQRGQRGRAICRGDGTGRCNRAYIGLGLHGAAAHVAANSGLSELIAVAGAQCVTVRRAQRFALAGTKCIPERITLAGAECDAINSAFAGPQCWPNARANIRAECISLHGSQHDAIAGAQCLAFAGTEC